MFETRTINTIAQRITKIVSGSLLNQRKSLFSDLLAEYPKETLLLLSMSLNVSEPLAVRTKHTPTVSEPNYSEILGEVWYYYQNSNYLELVKSAQKHSLGWQNIINGIFSKSIIHAVTEDFVLSSLGEYYSVVELMYYISLPEIIDSEELVVQGIARRNGEIIFPVYGFILNKSMNLNKLEYLNNYGGRVVSSNTSRRLRKELTDYFGFGRYGILFYTSKMKGYKYRRSFNVLVHTNIKNTSRLLRAIPVNFEEINPVEKHTILENKAQLLEWAKKNHKRHMVLVGSGGCVKLQPVVEYRNVKIVDYITNEEFEAIGVVGLYEGKEYPMYFDVSKTELIHGIQGRYVKVMVKKIQDEVVEVSFNSIPSAWHREYSECVACGCNETKHFKDGLCARCVYTIRKNITKSEYKDLTGLKDFEISLKVDLGDERPEYHVVHKDNKTTYTQTQGQLRFQF